MKACLVIPIYDHGATIRAVVSALAPAALPCLIVDDGSGPATRAALAALAREAPWVRLHHHSDNRGKGQALKTGYRLAADEGFTHVIQLDADGQHDAADVPRFLAAMRADPGALVLGRPLFDRSVPRRRLYARQISRVLVWLATLSLDVRDPLCGFRGVPLAPTLRILARVPTGDRMDFEPEIAVRLLWDGVPIVNLPTRVVYDPHGLSHFHFGREYPLLAGLYTRLTLGMLRRAPRLLRRRRARRPGRRQAMAPSDRAPAHD